MRRFSKTVLALCVFCAFSCVKVNDEVGKNFIPDVEGVTVYQMKLPLDALEQVERIDSLSCMSAKKMVIGSMVTENYGITKRSSAITLFPIVEKVDVGRNPRNVRMKLQVALDTLDTYGDSDASIIQNINVYALQERLDSVFVTTDALSDEDFTGCGQIVESSPVYYGGDSLSFNFSSEFAGKFVEAFSQDSQLHKKNANYLERFPGIYITTNDPLALGGRINMFNFNMTFDDYGYIEGNYAVLSFTADYELEDGTVRENVDTSYAFCLGNPKAPVEKTDLRGYACNFSNSERHPDYTSLDRVYVEGAAGIKPVVRAQKLRRQFLDAVKDTLAKSGVEFDEQKDIQKIIVNKASLVMPFVYDGAMWQKYNKYPKYLSPTVRVGVSYKATEDSETQKYVIYGGITDASIATENPGNINRSLLIYAPDITHHFQSVLNSQVKGDPDTFYAQRDVYLFVVAPEKVLKTNTSSSSSNDAYYQAMLYDQYYNNMYGGYGYGYGYGYGGYGYDYSNYYAYAAMMGSVDSDTDTYENTLDYSRYYDCVLYGPASTTEKPYLDVTFCVIKR